MKSKIQPFPSRSSNIIQQKPILKHTQSTLSFIRNETNNYETKKKLQRQMVFVVQENLNQNMELYNWRNRTQLPIAKVFAYKVLSQKQLKPNHITIEVSYQAPAFRLSQLSRLPLFQILYLMKQTLVGLERLYSKFGQFKINHQCIFLNKMHKCKVWVCQNLAENYPDQPCQNVPQSDLVHQIYQIFQSKSISSKSSSEFFSQILSVHKLTGAIQFIEKFAREHRIIISTNMKLGSTLSNQFSTQMSMSKFSQFGQHSQINSNVMSNSVLKLDSMAKGGLMTPRQFPKFINKKSEEQRISEKDNPQKAQMSKSKSFKQFKNLKQSTITKFDKSLHDIESSQNGSSNSRITAKSFDKLLTPKGSIWSPYTPKQQKYKQKSDFSFKKDNSQKDESQFHAAEQKWETKQSNKSKQELKSRKYSNDFKALPSKYKGIKIYSPLSPLTPQNQMNSQVLTKPIIEQRVAESPQSPPVLKRFKTMNETHNIKTSSETAESLEKKPQFSNIFQKNGWKMQINSLTENEISIRESIRQGKQERSNLLGTTMDFAKLGRMGRTIQGSMTPQDQFLNC